MSAEPDDPRHPCPHCTSQVLIYDKDSMGFYHVMCRTCGARGGGAETQHDAMVLWNMRDGELQWTSKP